MANTQLITRIYKHISGGKVRLVALLLLAVFLSSLAVTPASVYAAEQARRAEAPVSAKTGAAAHIKQYDQKQHAKAMKQDYAGPLAQTPLDDPVAKTDVQTVVPADLAAPDDTLAKPKRQELLDKRTATRQIFRNADGTHTLQQSMLPRFYKQGSAWQAIDSTIVEDKNAGDATNPLAKLYGQALSVVTPQEHFVTAQNDWRARFAPSDFAGGMVRVQKGSEQIGFSPVGAAHVVPRITTNQGKQTILYPDLWPGVDVRYTVNAAQVKEDIILKSKQATTDFAFRMVGAQLRGDNAANKGFAIQDVLGGDFTLSPVSLALNTSGPVTNPVFGQTYADNQLRITVDQAYVRALPDREFPAIIDPTISSAIGTVNFINFKSEGTICYYSGGCPQLYAGSLQDGGGTWRSWRSAMHIPYNGIPAGADIVQAQLTMTEASGTSGARSFHPYLASCLNNYNCYNGSVFGSAESLDGFENFDVTPIYQTLINQNQYGGWLMLRGQECGCQSYKGFDPLASGITIVYNSRPTIPTPLLPHTDPNVEAVVVTTQPTLGITTSTDANNDPIVYDFAVSSTTNSPLFITGKTPTTHVTVPEGLLQDGGTYVWKYSVADGYYDSSWQNGGSFKVDLRTGKDKTSTYQTVGPMSVSMNTGNAFTSVDTHSIKALDGSLGLSLNYNSPYASQPGLRVGYYNNTTFTGSPMLRRTEPTIDNNWNVGSPAHNMINNNGFSARYEGYFVAPTAGSYQFGANHDDNLKLIVNGQQLYDSGGCYGYGSGTPCWGTSITLAEGQVVSFQADYVEVSSEAYVQVYVKGAVAQTKLKTEWLRTAALQADKTTGLTGHYYHDNGSHDPTQLTQKFMTRPDPAISFDWGGSSPVPFGPADHFYVRWEGYFTAQATGTYNFGTFADDGTRIKVGNTTVLNNWNVGSFNDQYGSDITLTANTTYPITVEYFDNDGYARMQLLLKWPGNTTGGYMNSQFLSPGGKFVPAGWTVSADVDGNLAYERIETRPNGDVMTYDADGSTQLFTYTGSGYKPPVNEDGYLVRNADGSYSLTDTDGRVYVFNTDGSLKETTMPIDDRKPAALKYNYNTVNGLPQLSEILDGVTNTRKANLYYGNSGNCISPPNGFDAVPSNNLCAFVTSDGQRTDLHYSNGQLARIALPGSAKYDLGYEQSTGMLTGIRDVLANDAVAAGVRTDNATTKTEITYDQLKRVSGITAPGATAAAARATYTFDYLPLKSRLHQTGATEPNGYTQYIEYDSLLRTTKDCDVAALCTLSEWNAVKDLQLSTTNATGLKSTTLYDDDDKPTHQYGPAPTAWYDSTRVPQSTYTNQVPHTETKYDEGLSGPAVSWYDFKNNSLFGAPKLHTTGIDPTANHMFYRNFGTTPAPITVGSGMDGIGFSATGKLRVQQTGTFTFTGYHDDAIRLWIDDKIVLDRWDYRSDTVEGAGATITLEAGKVYRLRFDYATINTSMSVGLHLTGPGRTGSSVDYTNYLSPNYALNTSTKVYDATLGNSTSTTSYGTNPELSLPASTSVDPTGLNLTTTSTYEAPGATDSFLRQTHKYLPGANTAVASTATQYAHYGPTDTKDNPCTTGTTEAYKQAGFIKLKTEPDPDGTGTQSGRKTETIYDDAGRVVATRYNTDSWTCTTYDTRGRVTQTVIPAYNGEPARTVTNNYAVGGNPLQTSSADGNGTILTTIDLLGRTVDYADVYGNWTGYEYNQFGQLTRKYGDMGEEVFYYDTLRRLSQHLFDEVVYATVVYDAYSRVDYVDYNNAGSMRLTMGRDTLGRTTSQTYRMGNGTTVISDTVTRSQSGQITGDTISNGTTSLASTYTYDGADRLTAATIGTNTYSYGFGTQNSTLCGTGNAANANSGKSSNRTTQTINGTTTNFCYDYADRLTNSSNNLYAGTTYDSHGNMTNIGTGTTPLHFYYDSSDRASGYEQTTSAGTGVGVYYDRDVANRIIGRYKSTITNWNYVGSGDWFYNFTGTGDAPDFVRDGNWDIIEQNIVLPGGVLLTLKPQESVTNNKKQYSLTNNHGDTMLTANAAGTNTSNGNGPSSAFAYDPFGNVVPSSTLPANTNGGSYGWVGQHQKHSETNIDLKPVVMGARIYLPGLGRFTQVDPVEDGGDNSYSYPTDPINEFDLDGMMWSWKDTKSFVSRNKVAIGVAVAVVATVGVCAATAGAGCAVAVGRAVAWGAQALARQAATKGGVYVARTTAKRLYVGKTVNFAARAAQHARAGKIAKNAARIQIPIKSAKMRSAAERGIYNALGGKKAPWLENKIRPPWR